MEKCCRCKKEMKKFKRLGIPFYKKERKICLECYEDSMEKINMSADE